ncbi:MAG: GNAT family N-acetyltransferase [Defluviitaleaceae bacterium]|nr:GNAT family N-acetyltransferase [Defluviitaleaceae bacterium]
MKNNKDFIIRKINETDYGMCAKSLMETFKEEPWNEDWTHGQALERIEELMVSRMSLGYVAEYEGVVVGMCIGRIMTCVNFKELWVDEFSVNPSVQGLGVGSRLIQYVKLETEKEGIANMALTTQVGSPAVKFYEKNGFRVGDSVVFMHN